MFSRHSFIPGVAPALLAALGVASPIALSAQSAGTNHGASATGAASQIVARRAGLVARFGEARERAIAPRAGRADRRGLVQFVRGELLPYVDGEGTVIYPLADSIAGIGGYATVSVLLDREALERLSNGLAATAESGQAGKFASGAEALRALLETYFTKVELLVLPVLFDRLSDQDLRGLLARVEDARVARRTN